MPCRLHFNPQALHSDRTPSGPFRIIGVFFAVVAHRIHLSNTTHPRSSSDPVDKLVVRLLADLPGDPGVPQVPLLALRRFPPDVAVVTVVVAFAVDVVVGGVTVVVFVVDKPGPDVTRRGDRPSSSLLTRGDAVTVPRSPDAAVEAGDVGVVARRGDSVEGKLVLVGGDATPVALLLRLLIPVASSVFESVFAFASWAADDGNVISNLTRLQGVVKELERLAIESDSSGFETTAVQSGLEDGRLRVGARDGDGDCLDGSCSDGDDLEDGDLEGVDKCGAGLGKEVTIGGTVVQREDLISAEAEEVVVRTGVVDGGRMEAGGRAVGEGIDETTAGGEGMVVGV